MTLPRLSSHAWHILLSVGAAIVIVIVLQYVSGSLRGSLLTDNAIRNLVDTNHDGTMDDREIRKGVEAMLTAITMRNMAYNFDNNGTVDQNDLLIFNATLRAFLSAVCGNGAMEAGETCDDHNRRSGDGCDWRCTLEPDFTCSGSPSVCTQCGNGTLNTGETCDDQNRNPSDGCSAACSLETGYSCSGSPSVCALICGNGALNAGETCDDQNQNPSDGCSTTCGVEAGYFCSGSPSVCTQCGNGTLNAGETCDDQNRNPSDGCSATCAIETGFTCSGFPSVCVPPSAEMPLSLTCNNTQTFLPLGAVTDAARLTAITVASFRDEAYAVVGVTQSSGDFIPTIYRYTKVNQAPSWVPEARLLQIASASTFPSPGAVLIKTGGKLYAIRRGRGGEVSQPASTGIILRRTAGGAWEDLGTPWQVPSLPSIGSIIDFHGILYAAASGGVYRYDGNRQWSPVGSSAINPTLLVATNDVLYVIGYRIEGTVAINMVYRLDGSDWVLVPAVEPLQRISNMVGAGNTLLILGKHDPSNSATETFGIYRYQPDADPPLVDTRVGVTSTVDHPAANSAVIQPQLFKIGDRPFAFINGISFLQYNVAAKVWQDTGLWGVRTDARLLDEGPLSLFTSLTGETEFKSAKVLCKKLDIPLCGNGKVERGETCDDTNDSNTDTCTNACRAPACGDGFVQNGEECDDGNLRNEDSCTSVCKIDPNWCTEGSCTDPVSLSDVCTDTEHPVALGSIANAGASSMVSFDNAAYAVFNNNEIRRLMKNGDHVSWVREAAISLPSVVTLKSLRGTLYAVLHPAQEAIDATDSTVYRRNGGQWEGLGTPYLDLHLAGSKTPTPNIVNLLEHDGILYAAVRNYGNVYRYNNDHTWSRLGSNVAIAGNTQGLLELNSAVWGTSMLYAILNLPPTTSVHFWDGNQWKGVQEVIPKYSGVADTVFQAIERNGQAFVVGISRNVANFMVYRMNLETPSNFLTSVYYSPVAPPSFVLANDELFASNGPSNIVHYGGTDTSFLVRRSNNDPAYTINDGYLLLSAVLDTIHSVSTMSCKKLVFTVCRNGIQELDEECDDNNDNNNDDCTNACRTAFCGDGFMKPDEECDDRNRTDRDGCNADCRIEPDYTCSGSPSVCLPTCGNGVLNGSEACDDRNRRAGDGCNLSCGIETGYTCSGAPSSCLPTCGNGVLNGAEACDDRNRTAGDGCSLVCGIESGYSCSGTPSVCRLACGNGEMNAGEQCDDGGSTAFCTSTCTFAPKVCGDGVLQNGEPCDDGDDSWKNNAVANYSEADSCTSSCRSRTPLPYAFCARNTVYCLNDRTPLCPLSRPNPRCDASGSASCCDAQSCTQMANLCEGIPL